MVLSSDDRSAESAVVPGLESPSTGTSVQSNAMSAEKLRGEADHSKFKEPFHFIR